MKFLSLLLLTIITGCASSMLPTKQRALEKIVETKMAKNKAYSSALTYIAKNFGDSSKVIKMQNKDSGTIVLKGNTICNIFRQSGDINDYRLQFTLTISLKDKKAKLNYENLYISGSTGAEVSWAYNQLSSSEKVQQSMQCLEPMNKGLFKSNDW